MSSLARLALLAAPLLLLALTAIAGYAYSQVRYLNLPISQGLALFTVVLPLITGISTQGAYGLIQRSSRHEQYQLTIPLIAVIGFQLIYETIVATLSLTYILPPSSLKCGLEDRWSKLYSAKNADAIRAIQDSFNCCGFNSVNHKAFPFTDDKVTNCASMFRRNSSCFEPWRQAEQINAGLLLLVALIVFIVKVITLLSLLTSTSWTHPTWMQRFKRGAHGDIEDPEDDHRASMRRLIEDNANDEGYHDEPDDETVERALEAPGGGQDQGPRVEPSILTDHANEWRDEGNTSRT